MPRVELTAHHQKTPRDTPRVSAREKCSAEGLFASCGHNSHPVITMDPPTALVSRALWITF